MKLNIFKKSKSEECHKEVKQDLVHASKIFDAFVRIYNSLNEYDYHLLHKDPSSGKFIIAKSVNDIGDLNDGYHSFNELYRYRMLYNAAFFNGLAHYDDRADGSWEVQYDVHKSKKHSDGEDCFGGGWFIVMTELPTGQISNHYEMKYWDLFNIPEKDKANVWDGHSPAEAANRLEKFLNGKLI